MLALALLVVVQAAPASGRYVMSVGGAPAGVVRFTLQAGRYSYESTHFFRSTTQQRVAHLELDATGRADGRVPEALLLSTLPAKGCTPTVEELSEKPGQVCVDLVEGRTVKGRLGGDAFEAQYDAGGRLASLDVGGARFVASAAEVRGGREPFAAGFPVTGKGNQPSLAPAVQAVREVKVDPAATSAPAGRSCLELARAALAADASLSLVLGVVIEDDRAWPHAWVQRRGAQLDPSVPKGDAPPRRYLAFPSEQAGALYLELLAGTRRVTLE